MRGCRSLFGATRSTWRQRIGRKISSGCIQASNVSPKQEWTMIFHVVGVSFEDRQSLLAGLSQGDEMLLVKEPDNEYDPHAVSVRSLAGDKVGYIAAKLTSKVSQDVLCGHVHSIGQGENGLYGLNVAMSTMKLSVEMVPESQWGSNLHNWLPRADWDKLRMEQYELAGKRCEVCGGKGSKWPVECHEKWEYEPAQHVQRLVGLVALCPRCHQVKHLGRTMAIGKLEEALAHLRKVNNLQKEIADAYVREVFGVWKARSKHEWKMDLSWLNTRGIPIPSEETRPRSIQEYT